MSDNANVRETEKVPETQVDFQDSPGKWIFRVIKGALVGTGAILPGVSGGALCAAFGIYRPMMEFFAHPTKNFKRNIRFFLPFLIGCGIGFVGLAKLVSWLMGISANPVMAFFIGCIIATLPMLFKEGDGANWKAGHWITVVLSTAVTIGGLMALDYAETHAGLSLVPQPGTLTALITWIISGVVFALGAIVPGMSPSSILMYVGLYAPMTEGLGNLNLSIALPMIFGAVVCILAFSKLVSWLFDKACRTMFAVVIGIVLGSTLLLPINKMPGAFANGPSILTVVGCFAAGVVAVWLLSFLDKAKEKAESSDD
ncbi:MAG: DUF368 domain-containing protein [Ruminococcaceae bacterium]|nr:DUF368 domain-containing protein [Oscillospiraceae bacterium]